MKKYVLIGASLVVAVAFLSPLAFSDDARASSSHRVVFCGLSDGNYTNLVKPRNCIFASEPYGYQRAPIRNIRWRSWGGASAYGRGTLIGNMGFRASVRFKVYRAVPYEFGFYAYTRARGTTFSPYSGPIRWRMRLI